MAILSRSLLRSDETQARYKKYIDEGNLEDGCRLCERPHIKDFEHWFVIQNIFPYDRIAAQHDMILPRRHVTEPELNPEEVAELAEIKENYLHKNYDFIIEATHRMKSIPAHFHLHLIVAKKIALAAER